MIAMKELPNDPTLIDAAMAICRKDKDHSENVGELLRWIDRTEADVVGGALPKLLALLVEDCHAVLNKEITTGARLPKVPKGQGECPPSKLDRSAVLEAGRVQSMAGRFLCMRVGSKMLGDCDSKDLQEAIARSEGTTIGHGTRTQFLKLVDAGLNGRQKAKSKWSDSQLGELHDKAARMFRKRIAG